MVVSQKFRQKIIKERHSAVTASITGTGAVTLDGHRMITDPQVTCKNSGATLNTTTASCVSISGMAVTVVATEHQTANNIVSASAKNITVSAMVAM